VSSSPAIPDLGKDSADDIRRKWKGWATSEQTFQLNPMLKPVLSRR
jgi:hypothetical protein